jgi:hypothetical protein
MSSAERGVLARPENQRECVFYSQRKNGEVVDLTILSALRQRFPFLRAISWSALIALLPLTLTGCMGKRCELPKTPIRPASQATNQTSSVQPPK